MVASALQENKLALWQKQIVGGLLHWSSHEGLAWGMGMPLSRRPDIMPPPHVPSHPSRSVLNTDPQKLFTKVSCGLCSTEDAAL